MAKAAVKKKEPKRVVLETRFAGIEAGSILYVATPDIVADYVRKVPPGTTRSIPQMRRDLAKKNKADATCPVSTAIFLRLVAEVSLKQMAEGVASTEVTPFWRVVDAGTPIAKRLGLEADWIDAQRAMESA
jgi:hypothetical protein